MNLFVDACLTGMGGALGSSVYALAVTSVLHLPSLCTIVHLEMINVFLALNIWQKELSGKSVIGMLSVFWSFVGHLFWNGC